jgi:general secretion pathway protein A
MYLKHFALSHFPFDHSATPDTLFCASAQAEAEVRIKHLIELRGIGLVTGESGSGKTTICRTIAQSLHPGLYRLLYISLTTGNVLDMYKTLAWELRLPTERNRASAFRHIREEVTRLMVEGKQVPILILDESHHLRNDVLEDLRLLTNYNMDSENRLCILFVGVWAWRYMNR